MTSIVHMNGRFPTEPTAAALAMAVLLGLVVSRMTTEQVGGLTVLITLAIEVVRLRTVLNRTEQETP